MQMTIILIYKSLYVPFTGLAAEVVPGIVTIVRMNPPFNHIARQTC